MTLNLALLRVQLKTSLEEIEKLLDSPKFSVQEEPLRNIKRYLLSAFNEVANVDIVKKEG